MSLLLNRFHKLSDRICIIISCPFFLFGRPERPTPTLLSCRDPGLCDSIVVIILVRCFRGNGGRAWLGGVIIKSDHKIYKYLKPTLMPQAGVAAGSIWDANSGAGIGIPNSDCHSRFHFCIFSYWAKCCQEHPVESRRNLSDPQSMSPPISFYSAAFKLYPGSETEQSPDSAFCGIYSFLYIFFDYKIDMPLTQHP